MRRTDAVSAAEEAENPGLRLGSDAFKMNVDIHIKHHAFKQKLFKT